MIYLRNIPQYKEFTELVANFGDVAKLAARRSKYSWAKDPARNLYYIKAWIYTELNDLSSIENSENRGFDKYHLDHILPIHIGYKYNIDPAFIGSVYNIRFIPKADNERKGKILTESVQLRLFY